MSRSRIYIGELSSRATEDDIRDAFSRYGRVDRLSLKDGFAFITFVDDRDAEEAVRAMDAREFFGRRLRVEFAREKSPAVPNSRREPNAERNAATAGAFGSSRQGVAAATMSCAAFRVSSFTSWPMNVAAAAKSGAADAIAMRL